ncbi:MAG TPA: peptide ABC transporter substrate-binding protein [Candidatus Saccharimonadales bacterium]|nr:peptide ABC transporter substrate-binding protein [Candidatus Saccharimonadales bacterium]
MDRKRAFKLRFRRQLRMQRRQMEELSSNAEQRLENDFFKRLERLGAVRRFVTSWILLVILLLGCVVVQSRGLSPYYQTLTPIPGGSYAEGIVGNFTNASPIYATSPVDSSVSKLLFAALLTRDRQDQLVGDLAQTWSVSPDGTIYTVKLRPHLTWQDGQPLTASDVLFTYQVIQSPDAGSPLFSSWQGVKVATPDPLTVTFTLPNPLASFPYSLTTGIIPRHILGGTAMAQMRSSSFNTTQPVGAGPFSWKALQLSGSSVDEQQVHIALKPFTNYHGGAPKLSEFVVRTFPDSKRLLASFRKQELNAAVGVSSVPADLQKDTGVRAYSLRLSAAVMTFFKTSQGALADARVRQALVAGADTSAIISSLSYPTEAVREPLLYGQLGYNPVYQQAPYNLAAAQAALDADGWVMGADHYRHKAGAKLGFQLSVQNSGDYPAVARQLSQQWKALGVNAQVLVAPDDATFQNEVANHTYDAVLYGISIGTDPDVFVYWDSSQANVLAPVRLNLSEYKSAKADASLEAGRTRLDPTLRAVKYAPFLQAWQADAPALGLYQPRFLYLTHGTVHGLDATIINSDTDRFNNVQNWEVREARKTE